MHVITVLNQKGGVGKTSTCHHLAGTLAKRGKRVLLIDNDPQASLTQGFLGPSATDGLDPLETLAAAYLGEKLSSSRVIRPTGVAGVDLVAGSAHVNRFNLPEPELQEWYLRAAIGRLTEEAVPTEEGSLYDLILIDCPPNLCLCSWAALVASDHLLVPLQAEDYGSQGIAKVLAAVHCVQQTENRELELLGFLLTMFNKRLGIHTAFESSIRELYGEQVFQATVPISTDFKESIASRLPIAQFKPRSAAAKAMIALADELEQRLTMTSTEVETQRGVA